MAYRAVDHIFSDDFHFVAATLSKTHPDLVSHNGQEFNYVLEGSIAVVIGSKTLTLDEGDCIYFNPEIPHGQYAITDEAKFLTLIDN